MERRKQKKVLHESNCPLLTSLRRKIHWNGIDWYLCLGHSTYHAARQITAECPNLYHVFRLTDWIKAEMSMKKPTSDSPKGKGQAAADTKFAEKFPTILEYLTDAKWEDGTDREVSSVTVFVEDGYFKLALNDKDLRRSLYVTGETLEKALLALEKGLNGQTADWRAWNARTKKK